MVICLERGADLHMAQLMPLPLTDFSKIQIGFAFWYRLTRVAPDKGPLNGCVCVVTVEYSCNVAAPLGNLFTCVPLFTKQRKLVMMVMLRRWEGSH